MLSRFLCLFACVATAPLFAQVTATPISTPVSSTVSEGVSEIVAIPAATVSMTSARGVTHLIMGVDVPNGIVAAAPGSRVRVPPYEKVVLSGPSPAADSLLGAGPFQWRKDGQPIAGATAADYIIPLATSVDSGVYTVTGLAAPFFTTGIKLDVLPEGHLANQSSRVVLQPGDDKAFLGFVVEGTHSKSLLIRGVGPSLVPMGVTDPIAQPRIKLFDGQGQELEPLVRIQPIWNFAAWFASLGAFPLIGDGYSDAEKLDQAFTWRTFAPGVYSVQLSDASGQGGTALIEIYEFTDGPTSGTVVSP